MQLAIPATPSGRLRPRTGGMTFGRPSQLGVLAVVLAGGREGTLLYFRCTVCRMEPGWLPKANGRTAGHLYGLSG